MSLKSEVVGGVTTFIYLVCIGLLVCVKYNTISEMKLNEMGDFLSGVFGPIAFFWLVLGYLQQGRELKLSSDALQLQAAELQNSVEQQKIMAQAALEQIEEQRKVSQLHVEERDRLYRADLGLAILVNETDSSGVTNADIKFSNAASIAHLVYYKFDPPLGNMVSGTISSISSSSEIVMDISYQAWDVSSGGMCHLKYLDDGGKQRVEHFLYHLSSTNNGVIFTKTMWSGVQAELFR